jgi:hypothetical protein
MAETRRGSGNAARGAPATPDAPLCYNKGMTTPVDAIAEKLIEAAYELYGRPPEAGGEYIHTVARETDVVGYFLETLQFARGPRSRSMWQHLMNFETAMRKW